MANEPQPDPLKVARNLLLHYLKTPMVKTGHRWDEECDKEVDTLLDNIVQASVTRTLQEIDRLSREAQKRMEEMKSGAPVLCEKCGEGVVYKDRSLEDIAKDHKPDCEMGIQLNAEAIAQAGKGEPE